MSLFYYLTVQSDLLCEGKVRFPLLLYFTALFNLVWNTQKSKFFLSAWASIEKVLEKISQDQP